MQMGAEQEQALTIQYAITAIRETKSNSELRHDTHLKRHYPNLDQALLSRHHNSLFASAHGNFESMPQKHRARFHASAGGVSHARTMPLVNRA